MPNRIEIGLKNKILETIKNDGIPVHQLSKEYGVHHKTIYNWLKQEAELNGGNNANYGEIKRLKKDKEDLLLIIGELTAEINLSKKRN